MFLVNGVLVSSLSHFMDLMQFVPIFTEEKHNIIRHKKEESQGKRRHVGTGRREIRGSWNSLITTVEMLLCREHYSVQSSKQASAFVCKPACSYLFIFPHVGGFRRSS